MESAIDRSLKCPRTRDRRIPSDDYSPPYPAWTARAEPDVSQVVMAYLGVQWRAPCDEREASTAATAIVSSLGSDHGSVRHDIARFTDEAGYDTIIVVAYWTDTRRFDDWRTRRDVEDWWNSEDRQRGPIGVFREILSPTSEGFETLFSASDRMEGAGAAMGVRSVGDIQEHAYWGSMRDRFALSQTDPMAPSGKIMTISGSPGPGGRIRLKGNHNLAVIRSGQDWTDTEGAERSLYLSDMEPVLRAGMDYLRDEGRSIGCYSNRYMQRLSDDGLPLEKSFGFSFWRSLSDMEDWAEDHPTHLAIFNQFMSIVKLLDFKLRLRLYHEVSVLSVEQQDFEYINCHSNTGLMNGLRT